MPLMAFLSDKINLFIEIGKYAANNIPFYINRSNRKEWAINSVVRLPTRASKTTKKFNSSITIPKYFLSCQSLSKSCWPKKVFIS